LQHFNNNRKGLSLYLWLKTHLKNLYLFTLFVLLFSTFVQAQEGNFKRPQSGPPPFAKLSARVIDANSTQAIEFATVSLFRMPKDTLIGGIVTNANGSFELENLRPGKYKMVISFMGYKSLVIDTLVLRKLEERDLGNIALGSNEKVLREVTIETQQDMVKNTIDKKVFNAEKLAIANGGSANDVLTQVPTVSVDIDGNISLRGSGNVTILIDGRPSVMSGAGRAGVLSGIPASAIESVEVITNPSAKYDPDGMSGIINIVLKKNKLQGTNGNASISAGTNNKYNGNISYNLRKKKVNIYTNYSFRYNERYGRGDVKRTTYMGDSAIYLIQKNNSDNLNRNHSAKVGMDYNASKLATFGFNATMNYENKTEQEKLVNNSVNESTQLASAFNRYTNNPSDGLSQDYNLNYRQKFKNPKQLLSVESNYSINNNFSNSMYQQENFWEDYHEIIPYWFYQNNRSNTDFSINSNTIDFESPLFKNGKIESGLKNTNREIDNDFYSETFNNSVGSFLADDSLNNRFVYNENIYAAYTSYGQTLGKWSYKAGLRAEQANTKSTLINNNTSFVNNYFNVFPTAFINRKINDKQEVQLNYGRRINRPGTRQLSPFTDYSNPLILRVGNPYLNPEYTHNLELSYLYNHKKVNFSTTVFYRKTVDLIMRNISINSNNQTIVTFTNLGSSENMGIETVSRIELYKWWNITANLNGFQTVIQGTNQDGEINTSNLSWNAKFLSNMLLKKGWSLQASGLYNARNIMAQGTILPMSQVDFALKKDVFKNKGTFTLSVTDIFDQMRFRINTSGSNFSQEVERKRETRVATLTFNYRFGSGDFAQRRTRNKENDYKNDEGGF
jgi:outer membrane receptor protein involved in Fe transport